jgi:hypothetical protein
MYLFPPYVPHHLILHSAVILKSVIKALKLCCRESWIELNWLRNELPDRCTCS